MTGESEQQGTDATSQSAGGGESSEGESPSLTSATGNNNVGQPQGTHDPDYPNPREIRRLMAWGAGIIGGLLVAVIVFTAILIALEKITFEPTDAIRLSFVIGGTAVAAILSLIALYSAIVRGHLAPFVVVMALISFGLSTYLIMMPNIGEAKTARGIITVIFSVGTISIALILVMSVLFSSWRRKANDSEFLELFKLRFDFAKQVLTALLGILGTVVGFYFGSTEDAPRARIAIADVIASDPNPVMGGNFDITIFVTGGTAPFTYTLELNGVEEIAPIRGSTNDQFIRESVSLKDVSSAGDIGISVSVTDAKQATATFARERWISITASTSNGAETEPVEANGT